MYLAMVIRLSVLASKFFHLHYILLLIYLVTIILSQYLSEVYQTVSKDAWKLSINAPQE